MTTELRGGRLRRWTGGVAGALAIALVLPPTAVTPAAGAQQAAATAPASATAPNGRHVVAISVDGLNPRVLRRLGRDRAPNLFRLIRDEGAGTTNARTQVERTVTLPNHTSMVTGLRIRASAGGHGVTWNKDGVTTTVQEAAGRDVASVFTQVHAAGGSTAVFATKGKFRLFDLSWPEAVDRSVIRVERHRSVTRALRADLVDVRRDFYFLHLGLPDQVAHDAGFMSAAYVDAVARVDRLLGSVLATIEGDPTLRASTVVVLTSDHGGVPGTTSHADPRRLANHRVPFAIWGPGVANTSLYALNPDRANPRRSRPRFAAAPQPIRNGEVANVSLDLLGLGPVPGSLWNAGQDLDWN